MKNTNKYKPGSIGPSAIATAIKKEFGSVLSRGERKMLAKAYKQPLKRFYARG